MVSFIDVHRVEHGVESICKVLPIAPSTYYDHLAKRVEPARRSARAKRDAALRPEIHRVAEHRIRIEIPADYPATEPRVTMLDDSVPRHDSFHCSSAGVCCVTVFETCVVTQKGPSIEAFLEGPLRNFFLSQLFRREGRDWPFDEWGLGIDGWIDAVAELIGCRPRKTEVRNVLERRRDDDPLDMGAGCPAEADCQRRSGVSPPSRISGCR